MTEPSNKPGGRGRLRGVLNVALLAAGVFLALQLHAFFFAAGPERDVALEPDLADLNVETHPATAAADPPGPLGVGGMEALPAAPDGIEAPPEAHLRWAFRMPNGMPGARYEYPAGVEMAVAAFTRAMTRAGYRQIGQTAAGDARTVSFGKGGRIATIRFWPEPREKKLTLVVLFVQPVLRRPGERSRAER